MSTYDEAISVLHDEIDELENEASHLRGRADDLELQADDLRERLRKLKALDETKYAALVEGVAIAQNPRMKQLEAKIKRGLSWDEWATINREYQAEAERARLDQLEFIDLENVS